MKNYDLVVFDWDGTLVDSIERIVTSLQYASSHAAGINVSEQQAKNVIGLGLIEAVSKLHPELDADKDTVQLNKIADAYRHHYLHKNKVPAPLFEGARELLTELHGASITLAIATGKSRRGLQSSINEHNLAHYFSITKCADENRSKPHPEMLHQILQELNTPANCSIMIGDSEHDLKMATNAGMDSIGVTYGVHDETVLNKHAPLTCLNNITTLSSYLLKS